MAEKREETKRIRSMRRNPAAAKLALLLVDKLAEYIVKSGLRS